MAADLGFYFSAETCEQTLAPMQPIKSNQNTSVIISANKPLSKQLNPTVNTALIAALANGGQLSVKELEDSLTQIDSLALSGDFRFTALKHLSKANSYHILIDSLLLKVAQEEDMEVRKKLQAEIKEYTYLLGNSEAQARANLKKLS